MNGERKLLRIVPVEHNGDELVRTAGTQVLMPDGTPVPNVTGIVIRAAVDDMWQAEITCYVEPPEVTCLSELTHRRFEGKPRPLWWWIKAWWLCRKKPPGPKKFGPPFRNPGPVGSVEIDLKARLEKFEKDAREAGRSAS